MRLKKITIIGFKSFADKAAIDFDCDVIAIVGPNGCGKSNIVDAFRWVMGEQSAKSLRGDKMHDVLFAGTASRKPLGIAEVSITLSEIGKGLPTEYDEVTITRRLHRSGESEYLINRQPVRLKDIQDLLLGTGVGKNAFSVFEQGKLDQIIHLNPSERRVIFDEAAGIGRFLQRKKEALRKLEQVTENFNRVKDVHVEVEKQTRSLKKQAALAKTYQENKERLDDLEKILFVTKWRLSSEKEEGLKKALHTLFKETEEKNVTLASIETAFQAHKEAILEKEKEWKQGQKELFQLQASAKVQETELKQLKETLADCRKQEESLLVEADRLSKRRKGSSETIRLKTQALGKQEVEKNTFEEMLTRKQKERIECEKKVAALRETIKKQQADHLASFKETSRLEALLQEKTHLLQLEQKKRADLAIRLEEVDERLQAYTQESTLKKQAVAELSALIDQLKEQIHGNDAALSGIYVILEKKKKLVEALQRDQTSLLARQHVLMRLKEDGEGSSKGVKEILKEARRQSSPLYGKVHTLFECMRPEKGFEHAVAAALHFYADTLVVKTKADLEAVCDFASNQELGDFSLLCLEHSVSGKTKKKATSDELAAFVHTEEPYASLLEGICLVPTLEEGFKKQKREEHVTRAGQLIDRRSVLFQIKRGQSETNAFLREAELREITRTLEQLGYERLELDQKIVHLLEEASQLEEKRRSLMNSHRKKEMSLVEENFLFQRALADQEKATHSKASLQAEKERLSHSKKEEEALSLLQTSTGAKKEEQSALLERVKMDETSLESLEKGLQLALHEERLSQNNLRSSLDAWRHLNQEIEIENVKDHEAGKLEEKLGREAKELAKKMGTASESLARREQSIDSRQQELNGQNGVVNHLEEVLKESRKHGESFEKKLIELRIQVSKLEREKHALELSLAGEATQRSTLEQTLALRLQMTLDEMRKEEWRHSGELEEVERSIRGLRDLIEKAGAINMMAIEEYETQCERFTYLEKQLLDLDEAKKDLERIIGTLDQESKILFKQTFEMIRSHFQKNFSILFNGGEADLKFTDSPDILEAGIEIIAKPPGKQMRSISLLSGGEKCLTALALLFSIFEVRPAPFCILDEIDAPLDDSNIERFTNLLHQFTPSTQFIIVTHNKKTMGVAGLLIGVSMEEKGVSKLISLEFEKKPTARLGTYR